MSSSSRTSRNSSTSRPNNTPIANIFANLGFKITYPNSLEAMGQYPDASPLFEAIRDSFTVSSVLEEKGADDFETWKKKSVFPFALLLQASTATSNVYYSSDLKKQYDQRVNSAHKRLDLLKGQRAILQRLLEEKASKKTHSFSRITGKQQPQFNQVVSRYQSKIRILRRLTCRDIGSVSLDTNLVNYHETEQKYVERIADYASDVAQRYVEVNQGDTAQIPPRLISVLRSYGKICAQQTNCEILLARSTAFLTSLSVNDGSYLEMTHMSMNTLLRDIRSRAATCVKRKLEDVYEDAFKDLAGEVQAYLLSENLQRQDAYIRTMQACIRAYMLQRLRIHCFQVLVDTICRKRDMLFDSMSGIVSSCTSAKGLIRKETEPGWMEMGSQHGDTIAINHTNNTTAFRVEKVVERSMVDEVEYVFFSSLRRDASDIVQYLKDNIGARKRWIDLESPVEFHRTAKDFEELLTSSSLVLESLVRHFEALLNGTISAVNSLPKSMLK